MAPVGSGTLAARVARGFANAGVAFNHEAVSKMIRKELQELRPAPSPALDCRVLCVQAAAFSLGGDAGRKLPEHLGQPAWAMCCNRLAPMRFGTLLVFLHLLECSAEGVAEVGKRDPVLPHVAERILPMGL